MLFWTVVSAVVALGWQGSAQSPDDRVVGGVTRFLRGDRTLVNGFVRVPHEMLTGVVGGVGSFAAYRVEVSVTDDHGAELVRDAWSRRVQWQGTPLRGAQNVEPFSFAVAPGTYAVRVAVQDSGSGATEAVDLAVSGFSGRPAASDLLVAYGIRRGTGRDTIPDAAEVRKGDLLIASAPDLALTPDRARLWYYCEVYRDSAGTVPWLLRVVGSDGRAVVTTAATETKVGAGGGQIAASVDLAGLPPGAYSLVMLLGSGADTVVRTAPFRVNGFERARDIAAATQLAAQGPDMFGDASEAQLDSLFGPLVYLAQPDELRPYEGLTVQGKQTFLRDFWLRRDPTPGSAINENRDSFYERITVANRRFREGGAASIPGWRTDRGRVFIRYGEPDDLRREPQSGSDRPWEAWKYKRERRMTFVFLDLTRLGNYSLIYSDDKLERNPGDWTRLLSPGAINEIMSF